MAETNYYMGGNSLQAVDLNHVFISIQLVTRARAILSAVAYNVTTDKYIVNY